MAYYDPLYPNIEATRYEILRGLESLEEKLKLRRDLDRNLDLYQADAYARTNQLQAYEDQFRARKNLAAYEYDIRERAADRIIGQQIKDQYEEEHHAITHLQRLKRLEMEKLQLSRQKLGGGFYGAYSSGEKLPNHGYIAYDDDDALLRKYQDGTRAKEYQDMLAHTNSKKLQFGSPQYKHRKPIDLNYQNREKKRYEQNGAYESANKNNNYNAGTKSMYDRSPYAKIAYETGQKNNQQEKNVNIQSATFGEREQKIIQHQENAHLLPSKTFTFAASKKPQTANSGLHHKMRSKSTSKIQGQKIIPTPAFYNRLQDLEKSRKSKGKKSPIKLNKSSQKNTSALERSRSIIESAQNSALKKIDNRLRLSEIVYEDSKFRNIKHELNHLQMTFENEVKMRREIKDKINNHPLILRKHAMVVE